MHRENSDKWVLLEIIHHLGFLYNSVLLSRLLQKYEDVGNTRGLALLRRMSPVAWQHIFLNGHYTFISEGKELDLDAMIEGLTLS
ncbi:Tn3 family transposase [Shewanella oncorhynchi]|uniref:Tn3 family transposase n=1 Tax=Shewanella oncorhynchi TaxID=2726434 RepID=UPI003D79E9D3